MCCAQLRELEPADDVLGGHLFERLSQGIVDGILNVNVLNSGPGGPGRLLPRGSRRSVRALSGIRLVIP